MLKLVYAPDPILKKECQPLAQVDDHHRTLIKEMYEVMYEANGVGLAASSGWFGYENFYCGCCGT